MRTHEMKLSCNFNDKIFENLEDHEERLSFIFHLFVKSLINISDMCGWPLYLNFVDLASSESSHTNTPVGFSEHWDPSQLDRDRCTEILWCCRDP